jgi:hypothetical protein
VGQITAKYVEHLLNAGGAARGQAPQCRGHHGTFPAKPQAQRVGPETQLNPPSQVTRAITDDLTVGHVDHLIGVRDHVD